MKKIIEAWFNYHQTPDGDCFSIVRVGDNIETTHGLLKCTEIKEDFKDGRHLVISYEDGSMERQWNINKIIYE
jgi:hypothetical protein